MTRRALLTSVPRPVARSTLSGTPTGAPSSGEHAKGEPVVTTIWMAVSAATFVLGLSLPCLGALGSPLQGYVVPAVAGLYALALGATCTYNRLRYGRVWLRALPPARARRTVRRRSRLTRRTKRPLAVMIG
jgi:hypothetical protein